MQSLPILSAKILQSLAEIDDGVMIGGGQQPNKLIVASKERSRQNHDIFLRIELYAEIIDVLDLIVEAAYIDTDGCVDSPCRFSLLEMGWQPPKRLIESDEVFLN